MLLARHSSVSVRQLGIASLILLVFVAAGCDRSAASLNNEGNEAFDNQEYGAALQAYEQAQQESPDLAQPVYNAGNTHYRQQRYGAAQQSYEKALSIADADLAQSATFNLGNVLFNAANLEEAIEAYKQALRINSDDADAKHNLELALRELQQQQHEEDEEGQSQAQDQPAEQPDAGQQKLPSALPDQSAGGRQNQEEQDDGQRGQPQIQELTEEQARRLLDAVGRNAETLQGQSLRNEPLSGRPPARDW